MLRPLAWFSPSGAAGSARFAPVDPTTSASGSDSGPHGVPLPMVVLVGTDTTAGKLADRLRSGNARCPADVREEAVIRLSPAADPSGLDAALRRLASANADDRFDWLILLSRPACRYVVERADQLGIERAALARPRLAVVGGSTAEAARGYGWEPALVAPGASAADLMQRMVSRDDVRDSRVLVPRSAVAEDDVLQPLHAVTRELTVVTAYDNRPAPIDEGTWSRIANADVPPVIAFLSSSSVTALWSALPVDLQTRLAERARFVAMGPSTAEVLDRVRWPAAAIADPPGLDATAACIRDLLDD